MKTPEDFIKKIRPIRPNFEYCAENNRINGTLFVDIKNAIIEYHAQFQPIEPQETNIEQNILQIAYKITETIYNEKNSMECFGNFEVRMQELLLKYFNSVSAKNAYTESIEPQEERIPNVGKTIELREELISFARQFYADEETCIHNVDQYLTSKKP